MLADIKAYPEKKEPGRVESEEDEPGGVELKYRPNRAEPKSTRRGCGVEEERAQR